MPALAPYMPAVHAVPAALNISAFIPSDVPSLTKRDGNGWGFNLDGIPQNPYSSIWNTITNLDAEDNGTWLFNDIDQDGIQDLVYIKSRNTASGKIEIHAATGKNYWRDWTMHIASGFGAEENGVWAMSSIWKDPALFYIKTRNVSSGKVEVHYADSDDGYKSVSSHVSAFTPETNGVYLMDDLNEDDHPELVYIKTNNTASGSAEFHCVSGWSAWTSHTQDNAMGFDQTNVGSWSVSTSGTWAANHNWITKHVDYIKTSGTASGMVEVQVADSAGYKERQAPKVTPFPPNAPGKFLVSNLKHGQRPGDTGMKSYESYGDNYLINIRYKNTESGKVELSFWKVINDSTGDMWP